MSKPTVPRITLSDGNTMPTFGLGTWRSEKGKVYEAVDHALSLGYPHIDCAWVYGNENEVGEALAKNFKNGLKREDVFITTKLWLTYMDPSKVKENLEASLKALQLSYVDLYLIHWPFPFAYGPDIVPKDADGKYRFIDVPLSATWKAMEELVKEGLVKSIGVSNFSIANLKEVLASATIKPVMNQLETHPYLQIDRLREFCKENNIYVTAYSPLGNPALSADDKSGVVPLIQNEVIQNIAKKYNKSAAQILIRWSIERGNVVIPKSTTPARIEENFNIWDFKLDSEDLAAIAALGSVKQRVVVAGWVPADHWEKE